MNRQRKKQQRTSPRTSFGGKPRPWWHWLLLGIVVAGIIGFVVQMILADPARISLERLRFLISYAVGLFVCSLVLGLLEWRRLRR